jgi:hypothetical protein
MTDINKDLQDATGMLLAPFIERVCAVLPVNSKVFPTRESPSFIASLRDVVKPMNLRIMSPRFIVHITPQSLADLEATIKLEAIDAVVAELARWVSGGQQVPCVAAAHLTLKLEDKDTLSFIGWVDLLWSAAELSPRREGSPQELDLCWTWVCPMCTTRNYHHGNFNAKKHDPEVVREVCENLGVDDPANLCCIPAKVFCMKCETQYPTKGLSLEAT